MHEDDLAWLGRGDTRQATTAAAMPRGPFPAEGVDRPPDLHVPGLVGDRDDVGTGVTDGKRNSGAGFSPVTAAICAAPPDLLPTAASLSWVRWGWLTVWSPMRKPAAAIDRAADGKSRTKFPVR